MPLTTPSPYPPCRRRPTSKPVPRGTADTSLYVRRRSRILNEHNTEACRAHSSDAHSNSAHHLGLRRYRPALVLAVAYRGACLWPFSTGSHPQLARVRSSLHRRLLRFLGDPTLIPTPPKSIKTDGTPRTNHNNVAYNKTGLALTGGEEVPPVERKHRI